MSISLDEGRADGEAQDDASDVADDVFDALEGEESSEDGEDTAALLPDAVQRAAYTLPFSPRLAMQPRSYQSAAVEAWLRAGARGIVVLPTGAGKTVVAFDAIARLGVRTLVVVPTIELLQQWHAELVRRLDCPDDAVGMIGGGERKLGPITVITYDSAAMRRRRLDGYGLLVLDEVHHLPAQS